MDNFGQAVGPYSFAACCARRVLVDGPVHQVLRPISRASVFLDGRRALLASIFRDLGFAA